MKIISKEGLIREIISRNAKEASMGRSPVREAKLTKELKILVPSLQTIFWGKYESGHHIRLFRGEDLIDDFYKVTLYHVGYDGSIIKIIDDENI